MKSVGEMRVSLAMNEKKNVLGKDKKMPRRMAFEWLTIGELLSRGDETSKLDSSSCTSPYILPKFKRNGDN